MKSFLDGRVVLHFGDCADVIKTIPDNSIDAVCTDPPYALVSVVKRFGKTSTEDENDTGKRSKNGADGFARLARGFMGKEWDNGAVAFSVEFWTEVLRVLKPGAHVVTFGGTRTFHRLACAIEDAGFEIRDALMWHFATGFPKSHDVSKGIDKTLGVAGTYGEPKSLAHAGWIDRGQMRGAEGHEGYQRPWMLDAVAVDRAARKYGAGSEEGHRWEGWGSALKPATEIICLARKPLSEPTIAANVLRWGCGAINIQACRVPSDDGFEKAWDKPVTTNISSTSQAYGIGTGTTHKVDLSANRPIGGRFPANLCHDGSDEVLTAFPHTKSGLLQTHHVMRESENTSMSGKNYARSPKQDSFGDAGSAARFFASFPIEEAQKRFHYSAKASKSDRIVRVVEEVSISWTSEQGQQQAKLQVDTEQSLQKAIVVSGSATASEWSTFLFGSELLEMCRAASKFTIETETSSTIPLKILRPLTHSLTRESIQDANCETENGSSPAENVGMFGLSANITLGKTESLPGANHALSQTQLKISVSARRHSHPTTKPVALMQWLCRLICPPGGTILDPFAGTGTTGEAAWREGFSAVLIEREAEYQADIARRMEHVRASDRERKETIAKARDRVETAGPLFGEIECT